MKRVAIVTVIGMFIGLTGIANADTIGRNCYWERTTDTNDYHVSAKCAEGYYVVSGGCYSSSGSAVIEDSNPFENDDVDNLPDDGENWAAVDGRNGWRCGFDISAAEIRAIALCCQEE